MTIVECPVCAESGWYHDVNVHLFDSHDWTPLPIARWAAGVTLSDSDPEPQARAKAESFRARYFGGTEPREGMTLLLASLMVEIEQALKAK